MWGIWTIASISVPCPAYLDCDEMTAKIKSNLTSATQQKSDADEDPFRRPRQVERPARHQIDGRIDRSLEQAGEMEYLRRRWPARTATPLTRVQICERSPTVATWFVMLAEPARPQSANQYNRNKTCQRPFRPLYDAWTSR